MAAELSPRVLRTLVAVAAMALMIIAATATRVRSTRGESSAAMPSLSEGHPIG